LPGTSTRDNISDSVAAVVSDIEMPRVDGHRLTRQIRENAVLRETPVFLLSSIVSNDNQKKGEQVGATAQLAKPRYDELGGMLVEVFKQAFEKNNAVTKNPVTNNTAPQSSPTSPEPVACG
jgi:CheY-like chemotaxis protein